ncbi:hypothetical protein AALO_G00228600 [Alosa alosa]|uniref:Calponin-homology (CH) domain-containing protein n=1 Tax=Alosa alosa TaxID=278164 RepID=A0AAV6FU37_9TELE|nr:sperm flagellar protein 1 [Alosa sapidissima]XP_048124930.1 sperm flagellar protein 1 [Alosa alosa]KAG5266228.1 hypothetical protein AALO_G00228600 [Alosa alosa]
MDNELDEETLQELYAWIDKIPLSRPKRNITRDFSDGVMAAEVVKHFFPKLVELHNYTPANSTQQKLSNWSTLNRKVFPKLSFHVPEEVVRRIAMSVSGFIEPVLCALRERIESKRMARGGDNMQQLEYYSVSQEKPHKENGDIMTESVQTKDVPMRKIKDRPEMGVALGSHLDPSVRLMMEEKEQALLTLRETVEILQIKVNRLEHLVQLKDLRIEDLTQHLERYKTRAKLS